ncbi:glutathione S-transferase family protein [Arenibacterium sp. CAU 1754]
MYTVHHLNNSRSQRVLWLLEELGVPYELKKYQRDATTNLAPPELLAVHPLGKSPMIEDKGRIITESGAIVEYLCARHGPHMIPAVDTDNFITHSELMHFAEGSAMTPILLALYTGRLGDAAAPLQPRIQQQLASHFAYMEQMLRPSGHFVLDDLSAVDIMLSFPAEIAIKQGHGAQLPKLAKFVESIHARPAYQRALEQGGDYTFA